MKKSVILIIGIVYLASIFIVGLMGIKMRIYNQVVYVNQIVYQPAGVKDNEKSTDDITFYKKGEKGYRQERVYNSAEEKKKNGCDVYIAEVFTEGLTFELKFTALPDNATKKGFEYQYDKTKTYTVNEETGEASGSIIFQKNSDGNAVITFKEADTFILTVKPLDGANVKLTVKITVVNI